MSRSLSVPPDLERFSAAAAAGFRERLAAAERARRLRNPTAYRDALFEAYLYYFLRHPARSADRAEAEKQAAALVALQPKVRGGVPAKPRLWQGILLILVGGGAATGFLWLFAARVRLGIPEGLLIAGLGLVVGALGVLAVFFTRARRD